MTEGSRVLARPPAERLVLSAVEFDVVWERLGLGPTPIVLRLDSPGRTHAERRAITEEGWQGLHERGLVGAAGPDRALVSLLRLLARPAEQVELRAWWGESVRAVAAGRGDAGVLAVHRRGSVTLEACSSLPAALAAGAPPSRPGPGRAATVPAEVLLAALAEPGSDLRRALIARDVPATEAGLVARMIAGGERRAQIVALVADGDATLRRTGGVLTLLDGPGGRYLVSRCTAEDGVEWATLAPIDGRRLRYRIASLLTGPAPAPEIGAAAI